MRIEICDCPGSVRRHWSTVSLSILVHGDEISGDIFSAPTVLSEASTTNELVNCCCSCCCYWLEFAPSVVCLTSDTVHKK